MHIDSSDLQTSTEQSNFPDNGELSPVLSHRDVVSGGSLEVDAKTIQTSISRGKSGVMKLERWLTRRLLVSLGSPFINFVLWNGEEIHCSEETPQASICLQDRGTLWRLLRDPFFQFGELYSDGRLWIEGDLLEFLRFIDRGIDSDKSVWEGRRRFLWPFRRRRQRNTLSGSKQNIRAHYDLGNDFYRLWLDEQLLYTCAYFEEPGISLEQAQIAKMDHICRKIRLQPGETVIEAGCGWGAFALHAARYYGVRVKAYNISQEQVRYARERAKQEGLDGKVAFLQKDWREIDGACDAFVSIGMLEHIGIGNYEALGGTICKSLNPGGRALIHSIGQNQPEPFDRWIERRIFPGAYPPTLAEMMRIFEFNAFSVLDVENIRLHYAETLWHWLDRFQREEQVVTEMFDERFVRAWRLYLAGSLAGFESDRLQLFQVLFSREKDNGIPRTRREQYSADGERITFPRYINPQDDGLQLQPDALPRGKAK